MEMESPQSVVAKHTKNISIQENTTRLLHIMISLDTHQRPPKKTEKQNPTWMFPKSWGYPQDHPNH